LHKRVCANIVSLVLARDHKNDSVETSVARQIDTGSISISADALIEMLRQLAAELHPSRAAIPSSIDGRLEQDYGFTVSLLTDASEEQVIGALAAERFAFGPDGFATIHETREETAQRRATATPADGRVGRDSIQPSADLVGHAAGSGLLDEADERVLEDVVGDVAVPGHAQQEGKELCPPLLVDRRQCRLVGVATRARPLQRRSGVVSGDDLGCFVHAAETKQGSPCYRGLVVPQTDRVCV